MADITFDEVVKLADQLTPAEKQALAQHLLQTAQEREMTPQERIAIFHSMIIDLGPVSPSYSDRREDWYGDDGR